MTPKTGFVKVHYYKPVNDKSVAKETGLSDPEDRFCRGPLL